MKYILIIDCGSSSQMYVDDIIKSGYGLLAIYSYFDAANAEAWAAKIANVRKGIGDKGVFIDLKKDECVESVLERIKGYEIAAVLPGTDAGVRLADKLSKALGLRGNNPDTTYLRCTKAGMVEALQKAGVRHIMTAPVNSKADVEKFWNDNCTGKAVLKFSESSGTVGLKICDSLEDCLSHYKAMQSMFTSRGDAGDDILMQEYIGGTEYIVNSISIDGRHKVTDLWRYEKIVMPDGTLAYDTCILVDRLGPGMQELIAYDYKVLDAVHMENGFCHNEFKIDSKGPVLIETNPRIMGGNLTKEYLDEIFGSHFTDLTLKCYLNPESFEDLLRAPYLPRKSAMLKFAILPHDIEADPAPFFELVKHIPSYREIFYVRSPGKQKFPKTVDLETSPFYIRLTNANYGDLKRDYELIRKLEEDYINMLYSVDDKVPAAKEMTDLIPVLNALPLPRRFGIFADGEVTAQQYGERKEAAPWEMFDGAVYAECGETTLTERFVSLMKAMSQVRSGGPIIIMPESYMSLPQGAVAAEAVMQIMGVSPGIPGSDTNGIIYGIKR